MNSPEKYGEIINEINHGICDFSTLLADEYELKSISVSDPSTYTELIDSGIESQWTKYWPNKESYGVYFLLGISESDNTKMGLYIGKASLKKMGHRLYSHLNPHKKTGRFKRSYREETFIIEAVCSIPMPTNETRYLASALEEYLITKGLKSNNAILLNSIGNRN
jgi:hypothetical protein